MAIAFVQSAVNVSLGLSVTLGSNPVQGNFLVAIVNNGNGAETAGSGWTKIPAAGTTGGSNSSYIQMYYKIAGAGESTTQTPVAAQTSSLTVAEFSSTSGFSLASIDTGGGGFSGASTNPPAVTTAGLTPAGTGEAIIALGDSATTDTAPAAPAGTTSMGVPTAQASHTARAVYQLGIPVSPYSITFTWGVGTASFASYAILLLAPAGGSGTRLPLLGVG